MIFFMSQVNMFWEKEKTKDEEVAVASPLLITDWLTYISEKFNLLILQLSNRLFLVQGKFVLAFVICDVISTWYLYMLQWC